MEIAGGREISGTATVPGDKSISHRALMLGAAATGRTVVRGLPAGADVASTRRCLEAFGVRISDRNGAVEIEGDGVESWSEPSGPLDCGNSGTTMRVLAGLAARRNFTTVLDGDGSLRSRPMDRIARPLRALGAKVDAREDKLPPLSIHGGGLVGAQIHTEVASAQVKSCVLLAGLGASGRTSVVEPALSRDHTERMLRALRAPISRYGLRVEVGAFDLPAFEIDIPGDASSAAYLVAAALLAGRVRIDKVLLNPTRVGFLDAVSRMGGDVRWVVTEERMGEPVGWIEATRSSLRGIDISEAEVPALLDELPLLGVLATQAKGRTTVGGAGELRVKESDRIAALTSELEKLGPHVIPLPDGFVVEGPVPLRGADVDAHGDHRIAMSLAVAAVAARDRTRIAGWESASVSWPGLENVLREMGADVS